MFVKSIIIVTTVAACLFAGDTLEPIQRPGGEEARQVIAISDNGAKVTLPARQLWLEATSGKDGTVHGVELLVLFDRATSAFWWGLSFSSESSPRTRTVTSHIDALSSGTIKVYSGGGRIIVFEGVAEVRECRGRADSIDDAQQKALALARAWAAPDLDRRDPLVTPVLLLSQIDDSIYMKPLEEQGAAVHLESVTREESGWVLTIRGYWTARIALDEEYHIKHWERIPEEMENHQSKIR